MGAIQELKTSVLLYLKTAWQTHVLPLLQSFGTPRIVGMVIVGIFVLALFWWIYSLGWSRKKKPPIDRRKQLIREILRAPKSISSMKTIVRPKAKVASIFRKK